MRLSRTIRNAIAWTCFVVVASVSGGLFFAYTYVTDSVTIDKMIKAFSPKYLPNSYVSLTKARIRPMSGELKLEHITVNQIVDGKSFRTLRIPWLQIGSDFRAMMRGKFEPTVVKVAQPTLSVRRRADGTWNLENLFAKPWPGPVMKMPVIQIQNGTVELSEGPIGSAPTAILREVNITIESGGKGILQFDGTAKGDSFDRAALQGSVNIVTGRVDVAGDLDRFAIPNPARGRMPPEFRSPVAELGFTGGEVDLRIAKLVFDPKAKSRWYYDLAGYLRSGDWNCPKLPFPLNGVSGGFSARNGAITLQRVDGHYGTTIVRVEKARYVLGAGPAENAPFEFQGEIEDLKLDQKLRDWTPKKFAKIWDDFQPSGRVSVKANLERSREGGPINRYIVVDCHDVGMVYELFRYPIEHIQGQLILEGDKLHIVDMFTTPSGGKPLLANGTILNPGPRGIVTLNFESGGLPINKALYDAVPPDVRGFFNDFRPTGIVKGTLTLHRAPPENPADDPKKGKVAIDAELDLGERCGITWVGMPYPIDDLTGHLEIHPNVWIFKNMRGHNGLAVITGSGSVEKLADSVAGEKPPLRVKLNLKGENLPFNEQLRKSLQPAWQKTWEILDPIGSSDVEAVIATEPGKKDDVQLVLTPRPDTSVRLTYSREPKPGVDPGGKFTLRMEDVSGRFKFRNGPVDMEDVGFRFHEAPVQFERGRVIVENSGRFDLAVRDLWVKDLRLNSHLRSIMPPVMAQFAEKLDDGRPFTLKGNMGLGWSGVNGQPVRCNWSNALVVFNANTVLIQPGLAVENIQGQLDHVRGVTDGDIFEVHGALRLESVSMLGLQITQLESPIDVDHGTARLDDLRGKLLGGLLTGKLGVSLDATPKYNANLAVSQADLLEYAQTLPARQTFRGKCDARLDMNGFGGDLRTIQGSGEAHISDGDLGELPRFLRLAKIPNFSPATKTAFDSADIAWKIQNGKSLLEPIRLTGDAFSLLGRGTMDVQGELDVKLRVIYGRDKLRLRLVSDAIREAGGQFLVVRITGTPAFPSIKLDPLPEALGAVKQLGAKKDKRTQR